MNTIPKFELQKNEAEVDGEMVKEGFEDTVSLVVGFEAPYDVPLKIT